MSLLKKLGMALATFGLASALNLESKLYAKDIHMSRDYTTIQAAIDANDTTDGDRILVASGEYIINEPITYRGKNIILKSLEGYGSTKIKMETPVNRDRGSIFAFENGEGNEAILDGFTLTGGTGIFPLQIYNRSGGGVYCEKSSPTIQNNIIIGNSATYGGGIACLNANPVIRRNIISKNNALYDGGGIYCSNSQSIIEDNIIQDNYADEGGGGIICGGDSSIIVMGNCIIDNYGYEAAGGVCYVRVQGAPFFAIIENNIIARNRTNEFGGGILFSGNGVISGNTIVQNSAYGGGGIWALPTSLVFFDNLVYANTPTDLLGIEPSQVFYSDISQEGFAGINGNICADPCFVNPNSYPNTLDNLIENGNFDGAMKYLKECYSLQPDSNCIDAGDPIYLLDPDGTRADIGAVYFDQDRNKFIRGDADRNGEVNALDAVPIIYHLFRNKQLECKDAADVDDNGNIDINDVVYLIDYLYRDGPQPPAPFPEAGYDLTPDNLACYVCKKCEDEDINDDWKVNFSDYAIFSNSWLEEGSRLGDIYEDNKIDYRDLKNLADNWLWDGSYLFRGDED